jgi:DHA3 family macrolide efflux protein-like MFS transporter
MIAAATLVLAVLFNLGYQELWLLFAISAIRSLGAGVHMPAVSAFLPDIIPAGHIARVNGINNAIRSVSLFVAPILSLMFYTSIGLKSVFWIDVLTAVIGIGLLLQIKYESKTAAQSETQSGKQNVFKDIQAGVSYIFTTKWLRQFIGFYIIFSVMYGPVVFLTPLMVTRSFGGEVAFMGGVLNSESLLMIHEVSFALGMTVGGVAVGVLASKLTNKVMMAIIGCMAFAAATFVMGLSSSYWFYLGAMLPMGVTLPFINTGSMTVLQTRVEPELMGRVFGLVSLVETVTLPLSMVIFGPMVDSQNVSVELLLVVTGLLMLAVSVAAMFLKEMIAVGRDAKRDVKSLSLEA